MKMSIYSMLKTEDYCMQPYLASIKDREIRKGMAKFRIGSHWLEIQAVLPEQIEHLESARIADQGPWKMRTTCCFIVLLTSMSGSSTQNCQTLLQI